MNIRRYRARPRILLTTLADKTGVLLDLDTKCYFTMNEASVVVWQFLEARGLSDLDAIAQSLVEEFEVGVEQARIDCDALLRDLHAQGLVDTVVTDHA